ncbi:MAG: hypothetical protein CAF41_005530 [Nitrospira sp. CG24A]|nr:MAG: hypothetical protein CAF41_005530 [Nitrospira sp. CG24A]
MMRTLCRAVATGFLIGGLSLAPNVGVSEDSLPSVDRMWHQLLGEANALRLPTKFLHTIPPSFIQFEFDDLHSYAAEYHPGEHRMVLNRALSFNGAGAALRPLERLTHPQIETLYHELFHAYIDYLVTEAKASPKKAPDPVLAFARVQQGCRYGAVLITPVAQRKGDTEERFLTDRESWEALNETWAVFIGWAVWNQLEVTSGVGRSIQKPGKSQDEWIRRLKHADHERTLRGYYEPEDFRERAVARKRYLAPASRLSEREAKMLMKDVLEFSPTLLARASEAFSGVGDVSPRDGTCGSW